MYQIDFSTPIHIHFIGIGGISMSGFARLLHSMGFTISGSDPNESEITDELASLGIKVIYEQSADNINNDIDLVVYTAAIHPDNPEFAAAKKAGIPMMDRAEMVGQVMKNYQNAIAVSGTHGKTTTTSMLSDIFLRAGLDPTISVGGILKEINGNLRIGKSGNFITEACEYTNSFLKFHPTASIILNIDADHLDFFKDLADIRSSFHKFASLLPEKDGILVINGTIPNIEEITGSLSCRVITYGLFKDRIDNRPFDYEASDISFNEQGHGSFVLTERGTVLGRIQLSVVGIHNISNALAAIALSRQYDIAFDSLAEGLLAFHGTNRRFEYKGKVAGITVIDDYAHHPTEIEATLTAARKYPHKTLWCIFQPHTYSRTKALLDDFAKALSLADKVVLADIYAAREKDPGDISSLDLKKKLEELGCECYYPGSFDEILDFLLLECSAPDLLITMGAGDIVNIGTMLLGE